MKRSSLVLLVVFVVLAVSYAFATPNFVTPSMMLRNGLTDRQYEILWKQGKNPRIDVATMRDLIFRSGRYQNVTNWLDICGRTNDFAKLSFKLQGDNFELDATNRVISASNTVLRAEVRDLEPDAKELRKAAKAAQKAAKKDAKNFSKWIDDTEKARKKSSAEMAEFYDAIIGIATNAVPIPPNK